MTTKPMTKKARAAMRHAIVKEFGVPKPIWGPKAKPQAKPRAEKITPEERKHRRMMKGAWSEICKTMDYRRIRKIDWSVEKIDTCFSSDTIPQYRPGMRTLTITYF